MTHSLPSPLSHFDERLLHHAARLVPAAERAEWTAQWEAELWCAHHRRRNLQDLRITARIAPGVLRDAAWLRAESWRRAYSGTAALCLATLTTFCLLSLFVGLALDNNWHAQRHYLAALFPHCVPAAILVMIVAFATAPPSHTEAPTSGRLFYWFTRRMQWLNRQAFLGAKAALLLSFAFLASADLCRPMHAVMPNFADFLQVLWFVVISLFGQRWAFADQEQRCKHCLRLLTSPERAGRPSCNLLEWSGTEQVCPQGHGLLNVPAMETSWHQQSEWVEQHSGWDHIASA